MTPETPMAQRVRAALDAAPTSVTARRLLEIDAPEIARAYLDASAEVERLRAAVVAYREAVDEWDGLRDWSPCVEREAADQKLAELEEALDDLCEPSGNPGQFTPRQ